MLMSMTSSSRISKKSAKKSKPKKKSASSLHTHKKESDIQEKHEDHRFIAHALLHNNTSDGKALHTAENKSSEDDVDDVEIDYDVSSAKDVEKELIKIYENDDGSMPDMKHFEKRPRYRFIRSFFTLILSFVFLGAVAWLGFFIFEPQARFSEADVFLSISGDEQVRIGQDVHYRIRYRNAQNVPLTNGRITVRYPEGFVFTESSVLATSEDNTQWDIGALDEHESGYIDIYGTLVGDLNESKSFRVFFTYTPSNFSSEFQKVANTTVSLHDAPVILHVEGPEETIAGAENVVTIDIAPVEGIAPAPLRVVVEPSNNFTLSQSAPKQDEFAPYEWTFPSITEKQTVTLRGMFSANAEGESSGTLLVRLVGTDDKEQEFTYTSETYTTHVTAADISASLLINGSTQSFGVQPGDVLNASIVIKNTGKTPLNQVRVRAVFDAPSLDSKSVLDWIRLVDDKNGGVVGEQITSEIRRGSITWNQSNVSDFRSFAPKKDATIDISLPIKTKQSIALSSLQAYDISVTLEVQYEIGGQQKVFTTSPLTLTLNSDVDVEVRHTISEDASPDSSVRQHMVQWILTNGFHELSDVTLRADVYGDVTINPADIEVPAGTVEYDAASKTIVWNIPKVPTSVDVLALEIPIVQHTENPTQTTLVSDVSLRAMDTVTGESLIAIGDKVLLQEITIQP